MKQSKSRSLLLLFLLSGFILSVHAQQTVYPNAPKCGDKSWLYKLPNQNGLVFKPKLPYGTGTTRGIFNVPLSTCYQFNDVVVEMDVKIGPWDAQHPDWFHNIFWLYRGQYRDNTWANVNFKGPGQNVIRMQTNVDTWPYPYAGTAAAPSSASYGYAPAV